MSYILLVYIKEFLIDMSNMEHTLLVLKLESYNFSLSFEFAHLIIIN